MAIIYGKKCGIIFQTSPIVFKNVMTAYYNKKLILLSSVLLKLQTHMKNLFGNAEPKA